jgi:hypothetical protein
MASKRVWKRRSVGDRCAQCDAKIAKIAIGHNGRPVEFCDHCRAERIRQRKREYNRKRRAAAK